MTFAQTHLQLLNHLRDSGYRDEDLVVVNRAYIYACELFTGSYRASGKPFICHLVGTASVLASLQVRVPVVAAGLLHAVYPLGDFGAGWLGRSDPKREQVRQRMGEAIEALIDRYTLHPWEASTPAQLVERLAEGGEIDRDVVMVRLANEVDDHLDLGILYCRDAKERLLRLRRVRESLVELAGRLEQPRLSHALEMVFDQCSSVQVPDNLRTARDTSFAVPVISRARWRLRRALAMVKTGRR
jgi:(p)ppGpp synthase/HD superfamily hydrolase